MPGFGRYPYPLPRERLRFLGSADSRLMKLAPLTAVKAARARQHHPRMTRPDGHSIGVAILGWYPGR
jgi:hypothetical protein